MDDQMLSTEIDTDTVPAPSGAGTPAISEPVVTSPRDDLEAAFKEDDAAKAKEAPKAGDKGDDKTTDKTDERPKDEPEPKAEKVEAKAEPVVKEPKADEPKDEGEPKDRKHPDAPAKFLPRAKELWRNTPNEVKAEVDRVLREAEEETTRVKEVTQRYEAIRPYDELARQNGRAGIHESLEEVRQLEDLMQQNPIAALNRILMQAGPRKADGQPVSLFEVASHIVQQGPQGYQQMVAQRPQQQQGDPRVEQLEKRIADMQTQQAAREIIEPFAAKHPRYTELQDDIALFLQSGKIPASLSAPDRLAAAYDMAVRINPTSHATPADNDAPADDRRADTFGGSTKSIKSSPGSVSEDVDSVASQGETHAESIRKELRRMRA